MGSIDKCCTDCSIMNIVISWSILHRHCNTAPSDGLNLDAERSARSLSELSFGRATHHTITGIMTVITEYWCSQTPDDRFFNNINSLLSFCWYAVRWRCDQIYNGHLGNVTLNPHAMKWCTSFVQGAKNLFGQPVPIVTFGSDTLWQDFLELQWQCVSALSLSTALNLPLSDFQIL